MTDIQSQTAVLVGSVNFGAQAIVDRLEADGWRVATGVVITRASVADAFERAADATGLIVVLPQPEGEVAFLDVDDEMLEDMMERCIDLIQAVGAALERLPHGAAIVVVGNRGYLGGRGGVHEMALSGCVAGFLRSVALAAMPRNIRANLVAMDLPGRRPVDPAAAAGVTAFLVSPASAYINAETLLANRGRSLLLRDAGNPDAAGG